MITYVKCRKSSHVRDDDDDDCVSYIATSFPIFLVTLTHRNMDFEEMGTCFISICSQIGRYFTPFSTSLAQGMDNLFGKAGLSSFFFIMDCRTFAYGLNQGVEFVMDYCVYRYPERLSLGVDVEDAELLQEDVELIETLSSRMFGMLQSLEEMYQVCMGGSEGVRLGMGW